jgi:predicted HicB family RNase H-like nuclease
MSERSPLEVVRIIPRRQTALIRSSKILVDLNARVPESLWRQLRMECAVDGRSMQTYIAEAIEEQLDPTKRRGA